MTVSLLATAAGGLYMATFPGFVQMGLLYGFWGVTRGNFLRQRIYPTIMSFDCIDGKLQFCWINIEGYGINIYKNRGGSQQRNYFCGGDKGERGCENNIPGTYILSHQNHQQGISSA